MLYRVLLFGRARSQSAYGVCVLWCSDPQLLGAVQWGLALDPSPSIITAGADRMDVFRLLLGVVPALAGWLAAYLAFAWQPVAGVAALAVAVPILALVEREGWRRGALPSGYMGLRWIATAVMECCLVVVLLARAF